MFALLLAGLPGLEAGKQPEQANKARIELIVPQTSVRPGETVPVGVKFVMEPGWHIYWKNPGDAGQAPRFEWSMPGGGVGRAMRGGEWTASEPQFPVPVRWEDAGGIVGYGYAGTVVFPAEIRIPGSATPGQVVEVGVSSNYMVCEKVCLVEWASASAQLRVSAESVPDENGQNAAALKEIEAARQVLPAAAQGANVEVSEQGSVVVTVQVPAGAKNVAFFPNPPSGMVVEDLETRDVLEGFRAQFRLRTMAGAKVEAKAFEAVVGYDTNQGRRGVSVEVPVGPGQ